MPLSETAARLLASRTLRPRLCTTIVPRVRAYPIKTLHVLEYAHDPACRRTIHHLLSRGERRNSLARAVFHGQRGQLRRHYQVGQENQLASLGIMINVIVLWQTVYIQAALDHLAAKGYPIDPADVARLTPLGHPTINLDGRYRTTSRPPATGLRPLRIN